VRFLRLENSIDTEDGAQHTYPNNAAKDTLASLAPLTVRIPEGLGVNYNKETST